MNIFLLQVKWVTFGEILQCYESWIIKWKPLWIIRVNKRGDFSFSFTLKKTY